MARQLQIWKATSDSIGKNRFRNPSDTGAAVKINWTWFCKQIIDELRDKPAEDRSITLILRDLLLRAGGAEPKGFRRRSYWTYAIQGKGAWAAARCAGLSISLISDPPGTEVQAVAFRLDEQHPETFRIVGIRLDDSREMIGKGMTRDEATDLFMRLMESKKFSAISVEREQ